jgi:hypothetical protein
MNTPDEVPEGVTTILVPLSTEGRQLLHKIRLEQTSRAL